jgi:hypothetical protein
MRYLEFCLADRFFYDTTDNWGSAGAGWPQTRLPAPAGWERTEHDGWVYMHPLAVRMPLQGWKVHVSSCPDDAAGALAAVWDHCLGHRISFKFLPTRNALIARNLKYASRGGSGKFITIYPVDEVELERVLGELGAVLADVRGPRILSDLRWGSSALYTRYGGFARRECLTESGEIVPAVEDPTGKLVPDVRHPVFRPPDWVTLPEFLAPHRDALGDGRPPADFPYRISGALHFSNGGGVYAAEELATGRSVVLKEARPYAGLDPHGVDAVSRLLREREFLVALADVEEVVDVHGHFVLGEHHFLVQERVGGLMLNSWLVRRLPLIHPDASPEAVAEYTAWVVRVLDKVEAALDELHRRGITYGDLHPNNVLADEDDRVSLIDFEMAYRGTDRPGVGAGAPGYVPADDRKGPAADRYALACLRLAMFLPLTALVDLDPGKAAHLASAVARRFPVPTGYCEQVLAELGLPAGPADGEVAALLAGMAEDRADWDAVRRSLAAAILASATPERADRLFPGDIHQFAGNALGLAHGAAGVLHALSVTGQGRHPDHEQWLSDAVRAGGADHRLGFFDGLHGIAYVLDHLGRTTEAADLVGQVRRRPMEEVPSDLFGGLAGIGLNLLHLAGRHRDPVLERDALAVATILAGRLGDLPKAVLTEIGQAPGRPGANGLMRGMSGPALFFLRVFEHTGDPAFLDLAERALARDLRHCARVDDGSVQLDEGRRVLPYLRSGSAGVGVVLHQYLAHRPHEFLAGVLDGIRAAASAEFYVQSTLLNGRAGLIGFLSMLRPTDRVDERLERVIDGHLGRLSWHALDHGGHLAFPGEQLLRLSMDVGSGNAGILLALRTAHEGGELLPLLGRSAGRRDAADRVEIDRREDGSDDAVRAEPAGHRGH